MEIPLPYTADKLQVFLEFLQRTLGALGGWSSSGSWTSARTFVEMIRLTVPIPDGPGVLTTWTFTWSADETLDPIEVEAAEDTEADWEAAVGELVRRSLEAAFNGRREQFFRRDMFAYMGGRLDGEYWISSYRIAPADPDDAGDLLSERIVVLDHWVTAVDHRQSIAVGQLEALRFMTLLGAFTGLGFYSIAVEKRWVYTDRGESNRYQL